MIVLVPGHGPAVEESIRSALPLAYCATGADRVEVLGVDRGGIDPLSEDETGLLRALAYQSGWLIDGDAGPRLHAVLSATQRLVPLDELVWDTLRGVAESLTFDGEYCTRRVYYRAGDIGGQPLIDVRYQYEIRDGRVASDTSTIAYPYTDGGALEVEGQVYVRDYPALLLGDGKMPPDGILEWRTP
jgi:hypothetical protein